jgi:hypothetical protein
LKGGRHSEELGQFYNSFLIFCEVSAYQSRPDRKRASSKSSSRSCAKRKSIIGTHGGCSENCFVAPGPANRQSRKKDLTPRRKDAKPRRVDSTASQRKSRRHDSQRQKSDGTAHRSSMDALRLISRPRTARREHVYFSYNFNAVENYEKRITKGS